MCGLLGLIDFQGLEGADYAQNQVRAMGRIKPRGPDSSGTWMDDLVWLGHRRLSIIDLSEGGHQPMVRGDLVITYNGEIYNFQAIRKDLEAEGHQFDSQSDTEVLLAGWQHWGEDLLPKLQGMFAFAIWNKATKELTLARDHIGKKPLVYRRDGAKLAFGSDLVAVGLLWPEGLSIDPQAVDLFFQLRFIPQPWSILEQIRKLGPGEIAIHRKDGVETKRWHQPKTGVVDESKSEADYAKAFIALFDEAVSDRLIADVPVGAFLSGGIDSAAVVGSLAAQGHKVASFTIGFPGASDYYEERPAARALAKDLGIEHIEVAVEPSAALDVVNDVFLAADEPFADSSALPQYLLCRETRKAFTVALSGDGADEVFGGYRKYQGELWAEAYQHIPKALRRGMIEPLVSALPEGKQNAVLETFRRLRRFTAEAGKSTVERQAGWMRLLDDDEVAALLQTRALDRPSLTKLIDDYRQSCGAQDTVDQMLDGDMALGLEADMLVKVDRMSMANSLEVRSPFLDQRVVAFARTLPRDLKLRKGQGKYILRAAFRGRLPDHVFNRPKKGFEMPVADWLQNDLAEKLRAAMDPERLKREGWLTPELPETWLKDLQSGRRDTSWQLWALLAFQSWMDSHGKTLGVTPS